MSADKSLSIATVFNKSVFLCLVPVSSYAGLVTGAVLDPAGLVIPGAHVVLTCQGTTKSIKTDYRGRFMFQPRSTAENCEISVKHRGFAPFRKIVGDDPQDIAVQLKLLALKEVVIVVSEDPDENRLFQATLNSVSLSAVELKAVSNDTGDLIRYAKLLAGAAVGPDTVYVDGLQSSGLPPADLVARIIVNADPFSAEYADGDKTHVDVITKSPDRKVRFNFGGASLGAGGRNILGPGLRSDSRLADWSLSGPARDLPLTLSLRINFGSSQNDVPILVMPPFNTIVGPEMIAPKASVGNHSGSISLDAYYSPRENLRAHFTYSESRTSGSNVGVGGIVMADAGFRASFAARDARATVSKFWERLLYRGGFVVVQTYSDTRANSERPGVTVPGNLVSGGAPTTRGESLRTSWTSKNVLQSSSVRPSWTAGITLSKSGDSHHDTPNAAGFFEFENFQAYANARAGKDTGTWFVTRGNGNVYYGDTKAATFVQTELLRSARLLITGGLRADYQSGYGILISPRLGAATQWRGFVLRFGGGLFVRDLPTNVFVKAIQDDGFHLQQFLARNISFAEVQDSPTYRDISIRSELDSDLRRPSELMQKSSIERSFGKFTSGIEYTWTRDRHLLGSRRLADGSGWLDVTESNRSAQKSRLHSQLGFKWKGQTAMAHYERVAARDNTDGPFSFPAQQDNLGGEWARSTGISAENVTLVGNFRLPAAISLTLIDSWRGSAPYNISTGLDTYKNGLYNDRGGRARNSGNGPGYNSLSLYGHRRVPLPNLLIRSRKRFYLNLGVQADNLLDNKNYISLGSVVGSTTFGHPLAALPGRSARFWLNLD